MNTPRRHAPYFLTTKGIVHISVVLGWLRLDTVKKGALGAGLFVPDCDGPHDPDSPCAAITPDNVLSYCYSAGLIVHLHDRKKIIAFTGHVFPDPQEALRAMSMIAQLLKKSPPMEPHG